MQPEKFDELRDKLLGCVVECTLDHDIEEDRACMGMGAELSAE